MSVHTRNDISFPVWRLTQKEGTATTDDLDSAKRVLRYLKTRPDLRITFRRGEFGLEAYWDACY